jgi:hypothetical protein
VESNWLASLFLIVIINCNNIFAIESHTKSVPNEYSLGYFPNLAEINHFYIPYIKKIYNIGDIDFVVSSSNFGEKYDVHIIKGTSENLSKNHKKLVLDFIETIQLGSYQKVEYLKKRNNFYRDFLIALHDNLSLTYDVKLPLFTESNGRSFYIERKDKPFCLYKIDDLNTLFQNHEMLNKYNIIVVANEFSNSLEIFHDENLSKKQQKIIVDICYQFLEVWSKEDIKRLTDQILREGFTRNLSLWGLKLEDNKMTEMFPNTLVKKKTHFWLNQDNRKLLNNWPNISTPFTAPIKE